MRRQRLSLHPLSARLPLILRLPLPGIQFNSHWSNTYQSQRAQLALHICQKSTKWLPTWNAAPIGWHCWTGVAPYCQSRSGVVNVTNVIKKRIFIWCFSCDSIPPDLTRQNNKSPSALLAQAISAKVEDGNLKAAIRLLRSDDRPADPSPDTRKAPACIRWDRWPACLPCREILL